MNARLSDFASDIQSFRIGISDAQLDDLRLRLAMTRFPNELSDMAWGYGVPLGYVRELAHYWQYAYDWRAEEAKLNQLAHFTTLIDGQDLHFIHARSPEPGALPLLLIHGWPSSIVEFQKIIEPLTNPRAYGGIASDAFHVICPSLPGFGFSGPTRDVNWTVRRVAKSFATLLKRLGYSRYGTHGGELGAQVSRELGVIDRSHVAGVHLTTLLAFPSEDPFELSSLTSEDKSKLAALAYFDDELSGYARAQAQRPQALAYGLTDSPVGQLAWIVEKFKEWTDSDSAPEGALERDQLLTNVMLYWLTGTANSSARPYREDGCSSGERSFAPTGVALFPLGTPVVRRLAERDNQIVHFTQFDRGGHFPAMGQPDLLVSDLRQFFRLFR